jgi:DNA-binding NarL/FixJ family response regulator
MTAGEAEPAGSAVAARPAEDDACIGQSNGARTTGAPPAEDRSAATGQAEHRNPRLRPTSAQITELPSAEHRTVAARPVRVLLADAAPMHRSGLRLALAGAADLTVVGEAGDGAAAVDLARRLLPDVVVMDIRLPRLDGLAATRAIADAQLPVRVLILTTFDLDEHVLGAIGAGAAGFLSKDVPAGELVAAIRTVGSGGAIIAPAILARLLARLADALPDPVATAAAPGLDKLTEREREVFLHVARGHTNAEIARALTVSETTIKTHVGHLLTKLGLRDRVQAVVLAYESGLVKPGN